MSTVGLHLCKIYLSTCPHHQRYHLRLLQNVRQSLGHSHRFFDTTTHHMCTHHIVWELNCLWCSHLLHSRYILCYAICHPKGALILSFTTFSPAYFSNLLSTGRLSVHNKRTPKVKHDTCSRTESKTFWHAHYYLNLFPTVYVCAWTKVAAGTVMKLWHRSNKRTGPPWWGRKGLQSTPHGHPSIGSSGCLDVHISIYVFKNMQV